MEASIPLAKICTKLSYGVVLNPGVAIVLSLSAVEKHNYKYRADTIVAGFCFDAAKPPLPLSLDHFSAVRGRNRSHVGSGKQIKA